MKNITISCLSGFGILLVVLGHSTGVVPEQAMDIAANNVAYSLFLRLIELIYLFHMPLFFFISGFLYLYSGSNESISLGGLAIKKLKRLLIPYVAISSVSYPIKVVMSNFALRPLEFSILQYLETIVIPWNNTISFFWFLPTLFLMFAIAKIIVSSQKKSSDIPLLFAFIAGHFITNHENAEGVLSIFNMGGVFHNFIYWVSNMQVHPRSDQ